MDRIRIRNLLFEAHTLVHTASASSSAAHFLADCLNRERNVDRWNLEDALQKAKRERNKAHPDKGGLPESFEIRQHVVNILLQCQSQPAHWVKSLALLKLLAVEPPVAPYRVKTHCIEPFLRCFPMDNAFFAFLGQACQAFQARSFTSPSHYSEALQEHTSQMIHSFVQACRGITHDQEAPTESFCKGLLSDYHYFAEHILSFDLTKESAEIRAQTLRQLQKATLTPEAFAMQFVAAFSWKIIHKNKKRKRDEFYSLKVRAILEPQEEQQKRIWKALKHLLREICYNETEVEEKYQYRHPIEDYPLLRANISALYTNVAYRRLQDLLKWLKVRRTKETRTVLMKAVQALEVSDLKKPEAEWPVSAILIRDDHFVKCQDSMGLATRQEEEMYLKQFNEYLIQILHMPGRVRAFECGRIRKLLHSLPLALLLDADIPAIQLIQDHFVPSTRDVAKHFPLTIHRFRSACAAVPTTS